MNFAPHKLYRIESQPMQVDENGDAIPNSGSSKIYLCACFLHNVNTHAKQGYSGIGIDVTYYVNMDRRDDLKTGQEIQVTEVDGTTIRGEGRILDVKHTSGMRLAGIGEYTIIYI